MKYVINISNLKVNINILNQIFIKFFNKCKHIKLTIENPDINKIHKAVYENIIEHNKKDDYYFIKCDLELVFNNSEYSPHISSKLSD